MKRFVSSLLPAILSIAVLCLCPLPDAAAQDYLNFENSTITVSDPAPAPLPSSVKNMIRGWNDDQFEAWAIEQNRLAYEKADKNYLDGLAYSDQTPRSGQVYERHGYTSNRAAGYGQSRSLGRCSPDTGFSLSTNGRYYDTEKTYNMVYRDFNDAGGGPVTIINPYCRDYFAR